MGHRWYLSLLLMVLVIRVLLPFQALAKRVVITHVIKWVPLLSISITLFRVPVLMVVKLVMLSLAVLQSELVRTVDL